MIVAPKIRGFICTTAHPMGCAANVMEQIEYVKKQPHVSGPKKVLIIGASTGYGLASRITATFGSGADTIGVSFEKPADEKRTASAGWYNTAAFESVAHAHSYYAKSINGDAFSDLIKEQTIDLIKKDWQGKVDLVIYSLASPRRIHPRTGQVFNSTLKPIGDTYINKTVDVMNGIVHEVSIPPASTEDIEQTIQVMGGEDLQYWVDALLNEGLLANGAKVIAYSYIGPEITYPVYRAGTIGAAKEDLEKVTRDLNTRLQKIQGNAYISVNKALVTQASSAIPVVPLYISLLYKIMKREGNHEGCIEQMYRLFHDRLYSPSLSLDNEHRIRLDDWELSEKIQQEIKTTWMTITTENLAIETDIAGYREEFQRLFGFGLSGVDYSADVNVAVPIPSIDNV
ncbi:MAG: trans-2-enoyl-CoA reductase family protein [Gammaproteobacteria bacterium]|nr:trans-2-enoyl-CoA reductase family protein [Gammaproteobacteria bacterium]MCD8543190.1 trans-2-enoyl-CoA reductase family protein [Gammaproteobacteria bacterium]